MEKALSVVHDLRAFWFLEKPVEPRAFEILVDRAIGHIRALREADELKREFASVRHVKPAASRADSAELYLLGMGFRG